MTTLPTLPRFHPCVVNGTWHFAFVDKPSCPCGSHGDLVVRPVRWWHPLDVVRFVNGRRVMRKLFGGLR